MSSAGGKTENDWFFLHGLYLLSYCNGQCLHFYRFILFLFHYVYVRTVHVSAMSTKARRLGPLEIRTQVVVTNVVLGCYPPILCKNSECC